MLEVKGFSGLRFDPAKVGCLDNVITPPYDVIPSPLRAELAQSSPHNMVHLMLPQDDGEKDRYTAARELLNQWRADGALSQDKHPCIYRIEQSFTDLFGDHRLRCGFFAVARLPEQGEKIILGHERTFKGPVEDRLRLMQACEAGVEPIFVLYRDPEQSVERLLSRLCDGSPDMEATTADGATTRLWVRPFPDELSDFFLSQKVYIADGHHRFQTACHYRDQRRAESGSTQRKDYDYVMAGFVSFTDPGLMIYPPHRLVDALPDFDEAAFEAALAEWFDVSPCDESALRDTLAACDAQGKCAIGLAMPGRTRVLVLKSGVSRAEFLGDDHGPAWRDLDVAILHRGLLERILCLPEGVELEYEKDFGKALESVSAGRKGFAFLLNPTRADQVRACAEAGEAMPQKSTYFFPKLPSGMVLYPF